MLQHEFSRENDRFEKYVNYTRVIIIKMMNFHLQWQFIDSRRNQTRVKNVSLVNVGRIAIFANVVVFSTNCIIEGSFN